MKKTLKLMLFGVVATIVSFMNVNAKSVEVNSQDTLKAALADGEVDTIVLASDIDTTEKINITRVVTIDGAGHTIKYVGGLGDSFTGIYVLHYYKTTGTLKNITLTGAEAALNINGSVITLVGDIDVSGNRLGGIELGMGVGVEDYPDFDMENANIINDTEAVGVPTVWTDFDLEGFLGDIEEEVEDVDYDFDNWPFEGVALVVSKGQLQMFLDREHVVAFDDVIDLSDEFVNKDEEVEEPENVQKKEETTGDTVANTNPNTYDNIVLYLVFTILSLVVLGYTYSKATAK